MQFQIKVCRTSRFFHQKGTEKLVRNELCMQLTQQFQNLGFSVKDITLDYGFLLRLVNTFTVDTEEYSLLKVHDFTLCAHKSYVCILQIGSFEKKNVDLVLYIIGSDQKDIKLYLLDLLHLQRANKLSKLNQSIYSRDHPGR